MATPRGLTISSGGRIRDSASLALALLVAVVTIASAPPRADAWCLPPFAIADRWDDATAIAGYAGGSRKTPDWRNNGAWDREAFTDPNGNGLYDAGESFVDANANGQYDAEAYNSLLTGYVPFPTPGNVLSPGGDLGLQLTLVPAASPDDESPGRYLSLQVDCVPTPSAERPNGADVRSVDRFLRDLIASDADATWDSGTRQVVGSAFCISPRLIPFPLYDPRLQLPAAHGALQVTKIAGLFVEAMVGKGSATVRFTTVPTPCAAPPAQSSEAPVPVPLKTTWGGLKATYR